MTMRPSKNAIAHFGFADEAIAIAEYDAASSLRIDVIIENTRISYASDMIRRSGIRSVRLACALHELSGSRILAIGSPYTLREAELRSMAYSAALWCTRNNSKLLPVGSAARAAAQAVIREHKFEGLLYHKRAGQVRSARLPRVLNTPIVALVPLSAGLDAHIFRLHLALRHCLRSHGYTVGGITTNPYGELANLRPIDVGVGGIGEAKITSGTIIRLEGLLRAEACGSDIALCSYTFPMYFDRTLAEDKPSQQIIYRPSQGVAGIAWLAAVKPDILLMLIHPSDPHKHIVQTMRICEAISGARIVAFAHTGLRGTVDPNAPLNPTPPEDMSFAQGTEFSSWLGTARSVPVFDMRRKRTAKTLANLLIAACSPSKIQHS